MEGAMFTAQVNADGSVTEDRGVYVFAHCFDGITDISEIESVEMGDVIVPIG
jgi:hypothetical protein